MSFVERLLKRRAGLNVITGINGGTLQDQLDRDGSDVALDGGEPQRPTMLTPTSQQAITRPRTVTPSGFQDRLLQQRQSEPTPLSDLDPNFVSTMTRPRRAEPRDVVADDAQYLHDVQNKPLSLRDKLGLVSQNIATNLGGKPLPTRRQREESGAAEQVGQDLAVQKQKILAEQGQLVPVTLADGTVTYAPARTAGSLTSQQQGFSLRKRQLDAHNKRWDTMASHEAAQDAQRLYNSGAADDDDDLKAEIVRRMGLPVGTKLPNHDKGQVGVGDDGNFILIDQKSGATRPALKSAAADSVPTPQGSMQKTNEAGRERRFNVGQTNANTRAANAEAGRNQRAAARQGNATTDRPTIRRAAKLAGQIEEARQAMAVADEKLKRNPNSMSAKEEREAARIKGEGWATELNSLNAGYEAGKGGQGYPYYKKTEVQAAPSQGQYAGRRISKANVSVYAQRHGMTSEEAATFLAKEGAIIH